MESRLFPGKSCMLECRRAVGARAATARKGLVIEGGVTNSLHFCPPHGNPRESAEEPGEQRDTATWQSRPGSIPIPRCWNRFGTTPDQCPSHRVHQFKPHLHALAKACFNVLGCLAASQTCAPILPPRRHFLRKYLRERVGPTRIARRPG